MSGAMGNANGAMDWNTLMAQPDQRLRDPRYNELLTAPPPVAGGPPANALQYMSAATPIANEIPPGANPTSMFYPGTDEPTAYGRERVANAIDLAGAMGGTGGAFKAVGRGARLPMDEASRAARAKEMGFTADAYHGGPGTNPYDDSAAGAMGTIKEFRTGPEGAAFFTSDPALASDYAVARYADRAAVYPVKLRSEGMIVHDQANGFKSNPELMDWARKSGANVVEVRNASDNVPGGRREPSTVYMVLDPTAVRSRSAAFDPRERSSGSITAGLAGLMAGGAAGAATQEQTPQQ